MRREGDQFLAETVFDTLRLADAITASGDVYGAQDFIRRCKPINLPVTLSVEESGAAFRGLLAIRTRNKPSPTIKVADVETVLSDLDKNS